MPSSVAMRTTGLSPMIAHLRSVIFTLLAPLTPPTPPPPLPHAGGGGLRGHDSARGDGHTEWGAMPAILVADAGEWVDGVSTMVGDRGNDGDVVTLLDVVAAARRIGPYIQRTPLERSIHLSQTADADVWLKLECFQTTGSFKLRG